MSRKKVFIHPYTYRRYAFHCIFTSKKETCNKVRPHATYSLNTCLYICVHFCTFLYSFPLFALLLLLPMLSSLSPFPFSPSFLLYATPPHQPLSLQLPTHSYPQVKTGSGGGGRSTQIDFLSIFIIIKTIAN